MRGQRARRRPIRRSTGQIVNAEQNCASVAKKRLGDFNAYTEMTGEAKPTKRVMEEWLQEQKTAYKKDKGLPPKSKPKTEVVMAWLRAKRMA